VLNLALRLLYLETSEYKYESILHRTKENRCRDRECECDHEVSITHPSSGRNHPYVRMLGLGPALSPAVERVEEQSQSKHSSASNLVSTSASASTSTSMRGV